MFLQRRCECAYVVPTCLPDLTVGSPVHPDREFKKLFALNVYASSLLFTVRRGGSIATSSRPLLRETLGGTWRTVGIACHLCVAN